MSLPHFIHESLDDILCEWENECTRTPRGTAAPAVRRVHFGKVLQAVADDMKRIKAAAEPAAAIASLAAFERRLGGDAPAAPHSHASQLVDDYALLRASVVRLWRRKHPSPSAEDGGGSREKFRQFIATEMVKWAKVVKDGKVKIDS